MNEFRSWTPEEDATLLELTKQGASRSAAGIMMGRSENAVKGRLKLLRMTPSERKKFYASKRVSQAAEAPVGRPTPEMLRDRDMRELLPHRDLTGAFFGDPPIGLSALEGRR